MKDKLVCVVCGEEILKHESVTCVNGKEAHVPCAGRSLWDKPIHINWELGENHDLVGRKLRALFGSVPYGNFMDVWEPLGEVARKLHKEFRVVEMRKHPEYKAWFIIKMN